MRPRLISYMVDEHILQGDIAGLTRTALFYVGLIILTVILRYLFIYYSAMLGQSTIKDLRVRVFKHITSMRLRYFDQTPIGTSTTRTINDVESVNRVFTEGAITIVADTLTIFAVLGIMLHDSWRLTLIALCTMPLIMIASYIFKEKVKVSYQRVRTQISRMNAFLQERITGMKIIQIFNAEAEEKQAFRTINRGYTQSYLDSIFYYAVFFPVVEFISALALALMVWFGAHGYLDGKVTFGALVAFPIYLNLLFRPIRMIADQFNTLQMGLIAAERVFKILDNSGQISDHGTLTPDHVNGRVSFDEVSFAYDDENYVLHDVSFEIKPGETLAIVGSTGSGKSTIINTLSRFYEIQQGQITLDGTDIKKYSLENLRQRISVVLQDVFLFDGTIMENITQRDTSIDHAVVYQASKDIGAHEFIMQLPGGYDFKVTERGGNLSVGQRQLISFVRALVYDPDILVLDEATSSIDTETESIIQYAIEQLITKRTSIIIAHRLSTIRHADQVMVLDKGRITEIGPPDTLLSNTEGHYRRLYDMQLIDT
jgi:ATP-binding cassette subfamily B protein